MNPPFDEKKQSVNHSSDESPLHSENSSQESSDHLKTWVDDPYGFDSTQEILEAQNNSDELILDTDLTDQTEDFSDSLNLDSDSADHQLQNIAHAIAEQAEQDEKENIESVSHHAHSLEDQIAEDQALEKQMLEEKSAQEQDELDQKNEISVLASMSRLNEEEIQSCIETLIFLTDKPISAKKLQEHLGPEFDLSLFNEAIQTIQSRYQAVHHGFELVEVSGGFQFRTKPGRASLAQKLAKVQTHRLSSGGMETLAIIAYQQPLMKEEVDKIRGVDSSYFIRGLLEKKLIQISGRSELPGRPLLYSTTPDFLEIFGLKDLSALPPLRELEQMIPSSQTKNPDDEDPRVRNMRKLVHEMNSDKKGALDYDPREDEKILKEFREKVTAIPSSTPYLDELKAAEQLAKEQEKDLAKD